MLKKLLIIAILALFVFGFTGCDSNGPGEKSVKKSIRPSKMLTTKTTKLLKTQRKKQKTPRINKGGPLLRYRLVEHLPLLKLWVPNPGQKVKL